jgi:DNA-binding NarL/FixJ family response regulator
MDLDDCQRAVLREAAREVDRAGSTRGRLRAEEATDLWRALVAGGFTLVDEFDADGRRCVVAWQRPSASSEVALSNREREVAAQLAVGQSNKAIAYQLGVSLSTVTTYAARIARKLGTTNRVDLVSGCAFYMRRTNAASSRLPLTPSAR